MKNVIKMLGVLGMMLAMPVSALATPAIPQFPVLIHGSVKIGNALAPVNTKIVVQASGAQVASVSTTKVGEYVVSVSEDQAAAGTLLAFTVNGVAVKDPQAEFKMVSAFSTSMVNYDLAIHTSSSSSSSGGPATPAKPADPKNDVPAVPAIPAAPALDANGQVKNASSVNVLDGDIIQCKSSTDPHAVYIVKIVNGKKYIRHIVSLQIFNHYKHLQWGNLIQVASLDGFSLSGWVRVNTGVNGNPGAEDKVYEINGDQTRHWIDMTAAEFLLHGGSDEAIFNINAGELNLYGHGPAVRLQ